MSQGNNGKKGWTYRGLNLRAKSFLAIMMTIIAIFLVIDLVVDPVITGAFSRDGKIDTDGKVQQAIAALTSEISDLGGITRDWATWDDTYAFTADGNSVYIKSTLNTSSFVNNRLNLVTIIDAGGKIIWAKTYDRTQISPAAAPGALLDSLTRLFPVNDKEKDGIIISGAERWLIAAAPILTSEGKGPVRGILIFGRYLDDAEIDHLQKVSRLSVNIYPAADPGIPPEVFKGLTITKVLSESTIRGYSSLTNIEGDVQLVLTVDVPRTIYASLVSH